MLGRTAASNVRRAAIFTLPIQNKQMGIRRVIFGEFKIFRVDIPRGPASLLRLLLLYDVVQFWLPLTWLEPEPTKKE